MHVSAVDGDITLCMQSIVGGSDIEITAGYCYVSVTVDAAFRSAERKLHVEQFKRSCCINAVISCCEIELTAAENSITE